MKHLFTFLIILFSSAILKAQEVVFITQPAAQKVGLQDKFEVKYILKNARGQINFSLENDANFTVIDNYSNIGMGEIEITCVLKATKIGRLQLPNAIASLENGKKIRSNKVSIDVINGSVVKNNRTRSAQPRDPLEDFFDGDESDPFAAIIKQQQQMMRQLQQQNQQNFQPTRPQQQTPQTNSISKADINKNIFVVAIPDKTSVTLGEQIIVSYKLFTRLPMNMQLTGRPSLVGFWSHDFEIPYPPQSHREIYNGQEYNVMELKKTALFPTQSGTLELDAATVEGTVKIEQPRQNQQQNNYDGSLESMMNELLNESSFGYEEVPVKLQSQVVKINVTDIPTNKPKSYNGAVGTFNLESNINKKILTTDDNATITLRVSGTGNLKMIGNPVVNFPLDMDSFDPVVDDKITNTNDVIAGYKTFKYSFTPRMAGTFTIPPTEFTYFDPAQKEFKTLQTPAYTLHVTKGKNDKEYENRLPKEIHDINTNITTIEKEKTINIISNPIYWSGFGLPLLAYFGLIFFKRKEEQLQSDTILFKNRKANKVALKRLMTAKIHLTKSAKIPFYEETSKAVWLYLSDKLNIPLSNLSKEIASKKMQEKKVSTDLQTELFRVTNECEMALYSLDNSALQMNKTYDDAFNLIGKLENELA